MTNFCLENQNFFGNSLTKVKIFQNLLEKYYFFYPDPRPTDFKPD